MRPVSELLAAVVVSLLSQALFAQDAQAIIERGMKARCDKVEMLEKQRNEILTMTGKIMGADNQMELEAIGEIQADWPGSFRWNREWVNPITKGKVRETWCVQVDKGWTQSSATPVTEIGLIDLEEYKMEVYGRWMATLYPLKDKAFTLTLLKDARVGDEEVAVVKAALRFRPDVYLYFSKSSGHLIKIAYRAREGGTERRKEHLLSDYKDFDGIKLPTKLIDMQQRGNAPSVKRAEWTINSYKFDKVGADAFNKPADKK